MDDYEKIMEEAKERGLDMSQKLLGLVLNMWERAVALGIFDGTNPQGNLTREQAAVILDRLGQLPEQGGG